MKGRNEFVGKDCTGAYRGILVAVGEYPMNTIALILCLRDTSTQGCWAFLLGQKEDIIAR